MALSIASESSNCDRARYTCKHASQMLSPACTGMQQCLVNNALLYQGVFDIKRPFFGLVRVISRLIVPLLPELAELK